MEYLKLQLVTDRRYTLFQSCSSFVLSYETYCLCIDVENRPFSTIIRSLNEEKKNGKYFPNSTSTLMCLANFDILKNNPSPSLVHDFPL